MKIEIVKQNNGKYTLFGEFEVGTSGFYERRVIASGLSKKKASSLKLKYEEV